MYGEVSALSTAFGRGGAVVGTAKLRAFWRATIPIMAHSPTGLDGLISTHKADAIASLRRSGRLLVALSGGVDSAVLLALACEALGPDRVVAVTGRSAAVTIAEIADAKAVAELLGVRHEVVDTFELNRVEYRQNSGDRCFHCRTELFEILSRHAREAGCDTIAYGAIVDDLGDHRPGMEAARRSGVLAPLLDARIGKTEVRALATYFNLHIREKPASACLASRIPKGTEVTEERLMQVARAEAAVREIGAARVRVRHHGEIARIELDPDDLSRLSDSDLRARVVAGVRAAGFRFVVLDLEGYREGGTSVPSGDTLYSILPQPEGGQ